MPDGTIERELRIDARPETVFAYLTEPEKLTPWWPRDAKTDPVAEGQYRLDFDEEHVAVGEYVEVIPNERLVFTWAFEGQDLPVTKVEFTLTPEGGGTILRMVHAGLPQPAVDSHAEGWDLYLPRLAVAAAGGTNPPATKT
jgi:uncharacterized protein YndB with AHSA1/START domain